eukprot:641714-Pelagomonas_calceolata.AAC.1
MQVDVFGYLLPQGHQASAGLEALAATSASMARPQSLKIRDLWLHLPLWCPCQWVFTFATDEQPTNSSAKPTAAALELTSDWFCLSHGDGGFLLIRYSIHLAGLQAASSPAEPTAAAAEQKQSIEPLSRRAGPPAVPQSPRPPSGPYLPARPGPQPPLQATTAMMRTMNRFTPGPDDWSKTHPGSLRLLLPARRHPKQGALPAILSSLPPVALTRLPAAAFICLRPPSFSAYSAKPLNLFIHFPFCAHPLDPLGLSRAPSFLLRL